MFTVNGDVAMDRGDLIWWPSQCFCMLPPLAAAVQIVYA